MRIAGDSVDDSIFALLLLLPKDAPNERRIADILRVSLVSLLCILFRFVIPK